MPMCKCGSDKWAVATRRATTVTVVCLDCEALWKSRVQAQRDLVDLPPEWKNQDRTTLKQKLYPPRPPKGRPVEYEVSQVLGDARVLGNQVRLERALDRALYLKVNKVLEGWGGQWARRERAHVFPHLSSQELQDRLDGVVATGYFTSYRDLGCFETPPDLAKRLVWLAGVTAGDRVLEPSAGRGSIAQACAQVCGAVSQVQCVECEDSNARALRELGFPVMEVDFLNVDPPPRGGFRPFDAVVMNPPFSRGQDARHVLHAWRFLVPQGKLAAVVSAGILFRETSPYTELRELVRRAAGKVERLPELTFATSGTSVHTALVVLTRQGNIWE